MMAITHSWRATLLGALAAGIMTAQAADTTGCTPQEQSAQTLSQQLGKTQGVICPPDVDPAMKKPAPNTGNTPVIPRPGSPGGSPNVQPK
jgi:hypothetical protein